MAIRDWSARKLARVWALGLALEAALVVGPQVAARTSEPPEFRRMRAFGDSVERGLIRPRELTAAEREWVAALLRDSLGITFATQAVGPDTVTEVHLPPAMAAGVARFADRALPALGRAILVGLLVGALLYLPIPVGLLVISIRWADARTARRRSARATIETAAG